MTTTTTTTTNLNDLAQLHSDLIRFSSLPVVSDALAKQVDLRKYSRDISKTLQELERASLGEYTGQTERAVDLLTSIDTCDSALESMENVLQSFKSRLDLTTKQIRHLHRRSGKMSIQLKNRRALESRLRDALEKSGAPDPRDVRTICATNRPVDARFMRAVRRIWPEGRSSSLPTASPLHSSLVPVVSKLKRKACQRMRRYLLFHIDLLTRPNTNVQMVQQNKLRRYAYFERCLREEAPGIAAEIERTYVAAMSQVFVGLFRSYHLELCKLCARNVGPTNVDYLKAEHSSTSLSASGGGSSVEMMDGSSVSAAADALLAAPSSSKADRDLLARAKVFYTPERRLDILRGRGQEEADDSPSSSSSTRTGPVVPSIVPTRFPILVHVARARGVRVPYELVFRSMQTHLTHLAVFERAFERDFFSSSVVATSVFRGVFARTLNECLEQIERALLHEYDAFGILLMIKTTHVLETPSLVSFGDADDAPVAASSPSPLPNYMKRVRERLWSRFRTLMSEHSGRLKRFRFGPKGGTAATTIKSSPVATSTSRRFAQLCSSVLYAADQFEEVELDPCFRPSVKKLVTEMHKMLRRVSNRRGGGGGGSSSSSLPPSSPGSSVGTTTTTADVSPSSSSLDVSVFYINHFNTMIPLFETRVPDSSELRDLEQLRACHVETFVEEELRTYFSDMIAIVKRATRLEAASRDDTSASASSSLLTPSDATRFLRDFSERWRTCVRSIDADVIRYFSDFKKGVEILQKVLTQLLLYYTRFTEIANTLHPGKRAAFRRDAVDIRAIMREIKRSCREF